MLLYWQFNTEPKRGKQNFVYPRRRAPHVESLVAATLQQSAQRPIIQHRRMQTKVDKDTLATIEALNLTSAQRHTTNTEEYKNKPTRPHIPTTRNS